MYVYACTYVRMHACMYVRMHVCVRACMRVCMRVFTTTLPAAGHAASGIRSSSSSRCSKKSHLTLAMPELLRTGVGLILQFSLKCFVRPQDGPTRLCEGSNKVLLYVTSLPVQHARIAAGTNLAVTQPMYVCMYVCIYERVCA